MNTVAKYEVIDINLRSVSKLDNPFYADLKGIFKGPNGEKIVVSGFYDGDSVWKVRFSPTSLGIWEYKIISSQLSFDNSCGQIECVNNDNPNIHGVLRVNPEWPHHFLHEDGTNHFMMAYECDWLWALDLENTVEKKVKEFIDTIKNYGFNEIIMNVYAHDCGWTSGKFCEKNYGPPYCYAWEGNNENPDHSKLNTYFFKCYDEVMKCLLEEGVVAHIFIKVYNKQVNWPARYSSEEDLYFRYIVARYQAFPNIIWDFSKESYYETDKEYIKNRINLIRYYDGYHHMITVHDDRIFYNNSDCVKLIDFYTGQQHNDFYSSAIIERKKQKWPIFNSEFGYEHGPDGIKDLTYGVGQTAEELIERAYEVVMAGGYIAYYYTYTAWNIIDYSYIPKGYKYFRILKEFFTSLEWWKFDPHQEICCQCDTRCLAIPGKEYIFYVKRHTLLNLDLKNKKYKVTWWNIYTGEKKPTLHFDSRIDAELITFKCPFPEEIGILHIVVEE